MKRMKEIIDTWRIIEEYDVKGWKQEDRAIYIPEEEYDRVYEDVLNKKYIENLIKK